MKTIAFRSPFYLLLLLLVLACDNSIKAIAKDHSKEIQKGKEFQQQAFKFQLEGTADSAFSYFVKSRKQFEKASDSARIVYTLLNIGAIQYQYNDFSEMQATMVEALKFLDKKAPSSYKPIIYNSLGMAYCQLEDYPRAIGSYQKTLDLSTLPVHKLTAMNNIGYAYLSSGNFEKAFDVLSQLYLSKNINDSLSLKARVADNLGYCAFKMGRPGAMKLIGQGVAIREKIHDDFGLITSKLHLAEALLEKNKAAAMMSAKEAERLATLTSSPDDRLLALNFLVRNSEPLASQKYALHYFRISDSLQTARRKARNYFAEVKYNYKTERDEKLRLQANEAKLKLEQSQLENSRLSWLLAAVCILSSAAVIIYLIVKRNRRIRWKASYDTEVRISNRLHDELANDLHQAIVFTEANDFSKSETRNKLLDNLEAIYRRARGISRENASIGDADFSEKLKDLISHYGSPGQNVLAKGIRDVDWKRFNEQQLVAVHRTVQELLVNMKKHSQCSVAVIQFEAGDKATIAYSDNGIGMTPPIAAANGLAIMENRIRDLKGTVTFGDGGKGFRVKIEFPI